VLSATGKVFCAGHDLKEMTSFRAKPRPRQGGFFDQTFAACATLMQAIVAPSLAGDRRSRWPGHRAGCNWSPAAICDCPRMRRPSDAGVNIGLFCSTAYGGAVRATVSRKHAMDAV